MAHVHIDLKTGQETGPEIHVPGGYHYHVTADGATELSVNYGPGHNHNGKVSNPINE